MTTDIETNEETKLKDNLNWYKTGNNARVSYLPLKQIESWTRQKNAHSGRTASIGLLPIGDPRFLPVSTCQIYWHEMIAPPKKFQ